MIVVVVEPRVVKLVLGTSIEELDNDLGDSIGDILLAVACQSFPW